MTPNPTRIPPPIGHSANVHGLAERHGDEFPTSLVQWSAVTPDGKRHVYGDQAYVASGEVLDDIGRARIEYREITITYGEWTAT